MFQRLTAELLPALMEMWPQHQDVLKSLQEGHMACALDPVVGFIIHHVGVDLTGQSCLWVDECFTLITSEFAYRDVAEWLSSYCRANGIPSILTTVSQAEDGQRWQKFLKAQPLAMVLQCDPVRLAEYVNLANQEELRLENEEWQREKRNTPDVDEPMHAQEEVPYPRRLDGYRKEKVNVERMQSELQELTDPVEKAMRPAAVSRPAPTRKKPVRPVDDELPDAINTDHTSRRQGHGGVQSGAYLTPNGLPLPMNPERM